MDNLTMKVFEKKIILSSNSPRRKQLLSEAGFTFEIKVNEVEESYPPDLDLFEVPVFLSKKKADASRSFLTEAEIVITADTVVILGDKLLGKPKDESDAVKMLQSLSGKTHEVVTGVTLLSAKKEESFSVQSRVYFDDLTDEEINFYVKKYQPYDKAGAYAIQEWIGLCKILKIEGTYANIMGLPMEQVYKHLLLFLD